MAEFNLGPLENVPLGEGRVYQVDGNNIAVFRARSGQWHAVQAQCPHRGGPLVDGLVGGSTLICPLHGWKFDLSTGAALYGECGVKIYPVHVDNTKQSILLQLD